MEKAERSSLINRHCAPFFIGGDYLQGGHDENTTNATATFVRFNGSDYVVTCRHVSNEAYAVPTSTARLHFGRSIIQLKEFQGKSYVRSLKDVDGGTKTDISITLFGKGFLKQMSEKAGSPKLPIDLDDLQFIERIQNDMAMAVGFPDELKSREGEFVQSPMVEAIAAFSAPLTSQHKTFALHTTLDKPCEYGLSGMSGGPIFAFDTDNSPLFCGILFEGYPSVINGDAPASSAFFGQNDLFIRGYTLTPSIFKSWLEGAGF